ncbi:hypothetical protein CYMTET_37815 [Cymbomonas tetramitiformis]|uniref:Uncharacterized protein n=1 Tax=Cymbomonas tetramitiformis TaxID=36881 RepID=A0AAE0F630_9CHLO|nr:hypothetical protein CYMTET_37815 [Cymbomonas tetramitiformis]
MVVAQVWSALLKFAAFSQGIQCKGFRHMELALGAEGCRRKLVTSAQVQMRATQSIILSLSGQALGVPAAARVGRLSWDRVLEWVEGSDVVTNMGLVVKGWLEWLEGRSPGCVDGPASETRQRRAGAVAGCVHTGGSGGQAAGPADAVVEVLQVGTRVEVFWPGENDWFGGRVGEGALEEGAVVIEYFDGNPERDEVFLERVPRDPGEHSGRLIMRGGGGEVTVAEVEGWSTAEERGLLVGWRLLDQGGSAPVGVGGGADAADAGEARGPMRPMRGAPGGAGAGVGAGAGAGAGGGPRGRRGAGPREWMVRRRMWEGLRAIGTVGGALGGAGELAQLGGGGGRKGGQRWGSGLLGAGVRGGSGGRGDPRAAGQAQGQHGVAGLVGDPEGLGEAGWTWLHGLSVDECAVSNFPSLMVPKKLWGLFTECVMVALRRMRVYTEDVEAYKLFFLPPHLVLQSVQQVVKQGVAQVIKERCTRFLQGEWEGLHADVPGDRQAVAEADEERVLRDAVRLVKAGQLGKAAKRLERAKLAPATEETLRKLEQLHPAGTGRRQDVWGDRRRELQEQALELYEKTFDDVMRNLPRASGPGSSQWRWEHLWAVHCSGGRDALLEVCNHLAPGRAPAGVRQWLAGARLVALLKDDLGVTVRPIACGEVLRKLVAKAICRQRAKAFRARFCGRRQDNDRGGLRAARIGVAVKGRADLGVHTVQAALDRHPEWVRVKADAKNAFNAVHREAMFEAIERDFPELWAWTDLCYGVEANLGPIVERVQGRHPNVVISSYLDDAFFLGPLIVVARAYGIYMEEAVAIGPDIQPMKSAVFLPEGDASCFADEMPGARGELDFVNVLGVPVGKAEAVSAEMLRKVEDLYAILPILNKLGHAQVQGLLLRFCAHPRLGFWLRGVLPEMMREAAEEHDRRMQGALRDLLPVRPGLGFAQVWEDMRELFPTVTAGVEDLGAESDLPYVKSLQAAMQKVSETAEVVEEARGANAHLPPQVPKADDVMKLSDYSRYQKRAQRIYAAVLHSADWLWLAGHVGASRLPWLFSVTYNSIGPAFLRGVPCCPALELGSAEYRVALRHILYAEQPLLGQRVEEGKVATYGDVRPHHFIPFGVEVYGGLGPAAYAFLKKTQQRFRERRYMEANADRGEQVDGDGDKNEDEEAAHGGAVGWKEKWILVKLEPAEF